MQNTSNIVSIAGRLEKAFEFDHQIYHENFYSSKVLVKRTSGTIDRIPIIVSERLLFDKNKEFVQVNGELRSRNYQEDDGSKHIKHFVFCKDIYSYEEEKELKRKEPNSIQLKGYICKTPVYRITPQEREITEIILAVNRSYRKTDYLPCIAWSRNARYAKNLNVGDEIEIVGRIQSREFFQPKRGEYREVIEISVREIIS